MALLSRMLEVKKELKKVLSARRYSNPLFLELLTWYSHARIIKVRREKMIIKWKAYVQEVLSSVLINTIFKNIWRREALLCDQNKLIGFNFSWPENQPRSQILNKKRSSDPLAALDYGILRDYLSRTKASMIFICTVQFWFNAFFGVLIRFPPEHQPSSRNPKFMLFQLLDRIGLLEARSRMINI